MSIKVCGTKVSKCNHSPNMTFLMNDFFGPKHCKNGWLYNDKLDREEAAQIKDLYPRVIGESMVQNGPLMCQYATTIII